MLHSLIELTKIFYVKNGGPQELLTVIWWSPERNRLGTVVLEINLTSAQISTTATDRADTLTTIGSATEESLARLR